MASLTLNAVYNLFLGLSREASNGTDVAEQMLAVNEGYKMLQERMMVAGKALPNLIADPTNVATTASTNSATLPTDFFKIHTLFRKDSSDTLIWIAPDQIVDYEQLLKIANQRFFDTTNTGVFSKVAFSEPNMYFDLHFAATETNGLKLIYHQLPAELEAYDQINMNTVVGTFVVGETVTNGSNESTGVITAVSATYLQVATATRDGAFFDTGVLTGGTSLATAVQDGALVEKPQVLEVTTKYKNILAVAISAYWFFMQDAVEADAKSAALDNMIASMSDVNNQKATYRVGISK